MDKPKNESEKRPECDGCQWWRVTDGVPLRYEEPCAALEFDDDGIPVVPEIKIQDMTTKVHNERCGHPFDCKWNLLGVEYVECESQDIGCPCVNDGRCMGPSENTQNLDFYKGSYICLESECPMLCLVTKGGEAYRPRVQSFPKGIVSDGGSVNNAKT